MFDKCYFYKLVSSHVGASFCFYSTPETSQSGYKQADKIDGKTDKECLEEPCLKQYVNSCQNLFFFFLENRTKRILFSDGKMINYLLLQKLLFLCVFKVLSSFTLYALVKSYTEILKRSSAGLPLCTARNPHLLPFFSNSS